jgi:hypothetical protein
MSQVTPQQQKKVRQNRRVRGPKKGRKPVQQQNRPKKVVRVQRTRRSRQFRGMAGTQSARTALGIGATSFKSGRSRTITVQNDEFITAVTVANQPNFNVVSYPVNPGQSSTFPWLSLMAPQWEKYTFNMLEFYFKREVSEFATAGSAGKVIFSADFDASDAPPTTKQQMEDSVPHADSMPCENLVLRLPKNQMHLASLAKYVRPGGLPGNADIKTYDVANLNVATQGIPSNAEIGELRVRYSCTFSVPVLDSNNAAPANNQVSRFVAGSETQPTSGTPYQMLFADVTPADGYLNPLSVVNTAGSFVPPAGNYIVSTQINIVASGLATRFVIELLKNGSPPVAAGYVSDVYFTSGTLTAATLNIRLFVSANGTDSFGVQLVNTFSTGMSQASGMIEFQTI